MSAISKRHSKANYKCLHLALSRNAIEFETAVEIADSGFLPSLISYIDNSTVSAWRKLQNDSARFLSDAGELVEEVSRHGGVIASLDVGQRRAVLPALENALVVVTQSIDELRFDHRTPTKEDRATAMEVLATARPLPGLVAKARQDCEAIVRSRSQTNCT